jgi:hypothetical protein
MASEPSELSETLAEFQQRFTQLPDIEEPPRTLLHVLNRQRRETYWNEILSYFLDPTEPHGFGTDLLEAFLSVLESNANLEFEYDRLDFEAMVVESEWVTRDTDDRPDIVVYSEGNWFVCVEMKVGAPEGENQTERYVGSANVGDISKDEFPESGHHYVYLSDRKAASASAEEFVDIAWCEAVAALERFQSRSQSRYPAKSLAQLDDFLDTIRREMNMTDDVFERNQLAKMRLYLEYVDTIDEVEDAFETVYERERERWHERFPDEFEPKHWNDGWNCAPSEFGHIYREGWRFTEAREPTPVNDVPYRISFVHSLRNRELVEQGLLTFRLYCPWGADDDFTEEFSERFHDDEAIREFFGERRQGGSTMWLTEAQYHFDRKKLPVSYYETLRTAFEEHQGIAADVTRVFSRAVDEVDDGNR